MCMFCWSLFVLLYFFFWSLHCVVCSSSIYGFWLPLWYLQTPLPSTCRWNWKCTIIYNTYTAINIYKRCVNGLSIENHESHTINYIIWTLLIRFSFKCRKSNHTLLTQFLCILVWLWLVYICFFFFLHFYQYNTRFWP